MKILMVGNMWLCSNEVTDERNIRSAFIRLGHEVVDGKTTETTLGDYNWFDYDKILEDKPEVDFTLVAKGCTPQQIKELREVTGKPVFYWCFDLMEDTRSEVRDPAAFDSDHALAAIEADGYFGKSSGWAHSYEARGAKYFFLPEDCCPPTHDKLDEPQEKIDHEAKILELEDEYLVVFTGTYYDFGEHRPDTLREIQEKIKPIPLHIFGINFDAWQDHGFPNAHGGVWDENYRRLISRTKINLSIDWRTDITGFWSDRISQIQGDGGFVLARYVVGMERAFGPDKETCVYWNTVDDCVEKIKYYLKHKEERDEIAERGYEWAKRYMTFDYRVRQFLTILDMRYNIR